MDVERQDRRGFLNKAAHLLGSMWVLCLWPIKVLGFSDSRSLERKATTRRDEGKGLPADEMQEASTYRFKAEYATLLNVLTERMFPDDGHGPSAVDVGVADALLRSLASSSERAQAYSEGLTSIEAVSFKMYSKSFAELLADRQQDMLRHLDHVQQQLDSPADTFLEKVFRKLRFLYFDWQGSRKAAEFWLRLRRDCFRSYYSHELTWQWLGYVGPPFPMGYVKDLGR